MKCGIIVWVYLVFYVVVKGMVMKRMGSVKGGKDGGGKIVIKFSSNKMDVPDGVTFKKAEIIERNISSNDGSGGYSFKEKDEGNGYNWVKGGRMFWVDNENEYNDYSNNNDSSIIKVLKRKLSDTIVDLVSDIINITNTNYNTYNNSTTLTTINNIFNEYKPKLSSTINELIQTNTSIVPITNIISKQEVKEFNTTTSPNQTNTPSLTTTTINSTFQSQTHSLPFYSLDDTDESSIISEILTTLNT